jgi:hypothetical protein
MEALEYTARARDTENSVNFKIISDAMPAYLELSVLRKD